jgi:hypothetical protein
MAGIEKNKIISLEKEEGVTEGDDIELFVPYKYLTQHGAANK